MALTALESVQLRNYGSGLTVPLTRRPISGIQGELFDLDSI